MVNFKGFISGLIVGSVSILLVACGGHGDAPVQTPAVTPPPTATDISEDDTQDFSHLGTYTIRFAHWFGDIHPQSQSLEIFRDEVGRRSNGQVTVELFGNMQLGPEDVYIDNIKLGTLEMGGAGTLMARYVPAIMIAEMPFLFSDWDHARSTLGGELGMEITEPLVETIGVRNLAWTVNGFRQVSSNRAIQNLDDFSGFRLRVPNTPVYIRAFEALGVNPVAMPLAEVFTALEQNVVDGQDNPYATVRASSFYEVQSHILETRHMFSPVLWVINEDFYQNLPVEFREIIRESIAIAADHNWRISQEADETDKQWLIDTGVEIYVPDAATRQSFIDQLTDSGMYDWFHQEYGTSQLEAIIRAAE